MSQSFMRCTRIESSLKHWVLWPAVLAVSAGVDAKVRASTVVVKVLLVEIGPRVAGELSVNEYASTLSVIAPVRTSAKHTEFVVRCRPAASSANVWLMLSFSLNIEVVLSMHSCWDLTVFVELAVR